MQYKFAYDAAGRPTTVQVGTQTLSSNTYNANGTLQRVDYGNGDYVTYRVIEEMSLAAPLISNLPITHEIGSKTEYVALHYEERLQTQKELARISSEIQKLRYYNYICDTLLASLSPQEKRLIENKYVLHKTYDAMLSEFPDGLTPLSKSALWYQCKRIMKRLDEMLGGTVGI